MRRQTSRICDLYGSDLERHLFAPSPSRRAQSMIPMLTWVSAFALVIWRLLGR